MINSDTDNTIVLTTKAELHITANTSHNDLLDLATSPHCDEVDQAAARLAMHWKRLELV